MNEKELFSVSIKGVLENKGSYLLRKNQRNELELIGGRLEPDDKCPEDRLKQEFIEESGIDVSVVANREPWLYIIAKKNIIIVPFICSIEKMPSKLFDSDGGSLHWIDSCVLESQNMPRGYVDSIKNCIPRKSFSALPEKYFISIPNYTEKDYYIRIKVSNIEGESVFDDYLPRFIAPRKLLKDHFGKEYDEDSLVALNTVKFNDELIINYLFV